MDEIINRLSGEGEKLSIVKELIDDLSNAGFDRRNAIMAAMFACKFAIVNSNRIIIAAQGNLEKLERELLLSIEIQNDMFETLTKLPEYE